MPLFQSAVPRCRFEPVGKIVETLKAPEGEVKIAVVGKYVKLLEAYKSLGEALTHGGIANKYKVRIKWIDAEDLEREEPSALLSDVSGILVPGGFGLRGTAGKIAAVKYAREHNIPFWEFVLECRWPLLKLCAIFSASKRQYDRTG